MTNFVNGLSGSNITVTNATITNATITNTTLTSATISTLNATNSTITSLTATTLNATNSTITNLSVTNLTPTTINATTTTTATLNVTGNSTFTNAPKFTTGLVVSNTSGYGIKLDTTTPAFGWKDLIGDVHPDQAAVNAATLASFRGGQYRTWFYNTGDRCDIEFHLPHDYAPNTDVHLHLHWSHNGTNISGQLVATCGITYCKGHDQDIFPAEVATAITVNATNITVIPQYRHRIDEIQISAATPTNSQINSSLLEPDGLLLVGIITTTIPTITGGATNLPALLTCDLHYQSTGITTKNKTPNFYT